MAAASRRVQKDQEFQSMTIRSRIWQQLAVVAVVIAGFLPVSASAAVIREVQVTTPPGAAPVAAAVVRAQMQSRPGATFAPETLSEDIKRLYGTGRFADVAVEVKTVGDQVVIEVQVRSKPEVAEVVFQGNTAFRDRRLQRLIETESGGYVDEAAMVRDATVLREHYLSKGHAGTQVEPQLQPIADSDQVRVVFAIEEQPRLRVRAVEFLGNVAYSDRELRELIQSRGGWWRRQFRRSFLRDEVLEIDQSRLQQFYQRNGYLDFELRDVVVRPHAPGSSDVTLVFDLHEGEPYSVSEVTLTGNQRFSGAELQQVLELTAGQRFNSDQQRADIRRLREPYEYLGYLDLSIFPQLERDPQQLQVAIRYVIREGQPSSIRDINIRGNQITRDQVIRRELALQPGDVADAGKIRNSQSILMNMNYFSKVDIVPQSTEQENLKDLLVQVEEKRTGQLMLGVGFSSEDSVLGFLEVTQTNFDLFNPPRFTGGGQRMRLRVQAGSERGDYLLAFTEPWWLGRPLRLDVEAFMNDRYEDLYDQRSSGASVMVTRPWLGNWRQSFGTRLRWMTLSGFDSTAPAALRAEEGDYDAHLLTFRLSRDSRDRFIHPTRGSRIVLSTEVMSKAWGAYSDIYRLQLEATRFFPLWGEGTLKLSGEIGVTDALSGDDPAIFDRFFAGGIYSLRGFQRREVGPVYPGTDEARGGRSMFEGSVEVIYPLAEKIYGSVFCDFGNVWAERTGWDPGQLNASIGVGLQFDLPIGPIRFDYGYRILTDQDHITKGGRLHFNLGYSF